MRFLLTFAAISLLFIAVACNKDETTTAENPTNQAQSTPLDEVKVVDGMLAFENDSALEQGIMALSSLRPEERIKWEKEKGFESMKTLCETISLEFDSLKTLDEYYSLRATYGSLVIFGELEGDNQAFYVPLEKMYYLPVANIYGKVMIAGKVINYKSDAVMKRMIDTQSPLKAAGDDLDHCKKTGSVYQILCLVEKNSLC